MNVALANGMVVVAQSHGHQDHLS